MENLVGLEELTVYCWEDTTFVNLINLRVLKAKCGSCCKVTVPNGFGVLQKLVVFDGKVDVNIDVANSKRYNLRTLSLSRCEFKKWSALKLCSKLKSLIINYPVVNKDELAIMNKEIAGIRAYLQEFCLAP